MCLAIPVIPLKMSGKVRDQYPAGREPGANGWAATRVPSSLAALTTWASTVVDSLTGHAVPATGAVPGRNAAYRHSTMATVARTCALSGERGS